MRAKQQRTVAEICEVARKMRESSLGMVYAAGPHGGHIAPALSIIEICAVLYGAVLNVDPASPDCPDRDRFLLSKGHGALALYTGLAEAGFLSPAELATYETPESILSGQPAMCIEKGIEISSGSLGLGLSVGIGVALAGRKANREYKTYVLLGDGECNEGTVWEAAMSASHFKLGNLTAIVDANGMQSDGLCQEVLDMGSHEDKWRSFGWDVCSVDGHDIGALLSVFTGVRSGCDRPLAVIARTVKGKGVSFMENDNRWHHSRLTQQQYEAAIQELASI
jgi:transketolase